MLMKETTFYTSQKRSVYFWFSIDYRRYLPALWLGPKGCIIFLVFDWLSTPSASVMVRALGSQVDNKVFDQTILDILESYLYDLLHWSFLKHKVRHLVFYFIANILLYLLLLLLPIVGELHFLFVDIEINSFPKTL